MTSDLTVTAQYKKKEDADTSEGSRWDSEAVDLDEANWYWLDWFGSFSKKYYPWIFHPDHAWLYCMTPPEGTSVFFYDMDLGWLFTRPDLYPSMFSFKKSAWLWYQKGSRSPRWFCDMSTEEWEKH